MKQEIADLKQKIDSQANENEECAALLRRKHQESISELSAHMESLNRTKFKFEKDNKTFLHQVDELRSENDNLIRAKSHALASCREYETKNAEQSQRIDELIKQLNETTELKNKLAKEHAEYYRRYTQVEFEYQQLTVTNKRLVQEVDDARMTLETEILVRNSLESKLRNLQLDLDAANGHLEEESESKLELQRQLNRLQEEFRVTREKIEKECEAKIEDIEDSK